MSTSEPDEYDAYFAPIDPEELAAIDAATTRALSHDHTAEREPSHVQRLASRTPPSPDEFDAYDFAEFTAEDFAHIDEMVLAILPSTSPVHTNAGSGGGGSVDGGSARREGGDVPNGGPRIEIAVERAANANPYHRLKDSWVGKYAKRSPYKLFRSRNGFLSVTDLTSPSWCEVQFDYGLRQKRSWKFADRPASFLSAEGKKITVAQSVAAVNDRTVSRGKSVHKVLERQIQPEAVQVQVTTAEERWALRLLNLMASLETLMQLGYCREIPVFGIVHDQIVTGIIDEVVRKPIPTVRPVEPEARSPRLSLDKRPAPQTTPSSPKKRSPKKSRLGTAVDQHYITAFLPEKSQDADLYVSSNATEPTTPVQTMEQLPETDIPRASSGVIQYSLHLSDTKTRVRPTLPPDEDTFASRIQLMLYHRLLNNLLSAAQPQISSSERLDLESFWQRVGVDPTLKFSDSFLLQAGLLSPSLEDGSTTDQEFDVSGLRCLTDVTAAWRHTVEASNIVGIDETLTLVYRLQPKKGKRLEGEEKERLRSPSILSDREAQDIAAAVQASISDVQPGSGGDDDLARAMFESLKEALQSGEVSEGELGVLTHPFGPPISEASSSALAPEGESRNPDAAAPALQTLSDDPQLAWALQQSLLSHVEEVPVLKEAISEAAASAIDAPMVNGDTFAPEVSLKGKLEPPVLGESAEAAMTTPPSPSPACVEHGDVEEAITAAELDVEARILGTKAFEMDDAHLDEYLAWILSWWHGERAPQGVDVELTRRCVTCEYRDGCEWREKKAGKAFQEYQDRRGSPSKR